MWWPSRRPRAFSRLALAAALVLSVGALTPVQAQEVAPLAGSVPVRIEIPKIGTNADVVPLAEEEDGTMQAPADPDTVGWYELGIGVGAPGNVLLDGHVDWGGRLRVFGGLRLLEPGDAVHVTDVDGNVLTYEVAWTRLYAADTAPLDEIFEQTENEQLTLITCGGAFDPDTHMYVSRWIVRAVRSS
jgi:sortase A